MYKITCALEEIKEPDEYLYVRTVMNSDGKFK